MDSGHFHPIAGSGSPFTQVHFTPMNGNEVIIDGWPQKIPPGVAVESGGVIGTYNDASIDRVLHQTLSPNTLYYVYVYMLSGAMMMDFSTTGHMTDASTGTQIRVGDSARTLIGMVYTDANGKFTGVSNKQLIISWFNRGWMTGLTASLGGATVANTNLVELTNGYRLEWLQWGLNNAFTQGYTVPNIYFKARVVASLNGQYVQTSIGLDTPGMAGSVECELLPTTSEPRTLNSVLVGAGGTSEGRHVAIPMMSITAGTATIQSGQIYSSPFQS